tara:strand:- start:407 stop:712 length:306 start_codon:yes stop_codon:yes gene_type:complete
MPKWNNIGLISEYNKGNQWLIEIGTKPVALFKYNDDYYAIKNSCAHQGYPLAEGNLKDCMVECPLHGWVYDIRDGNCLSLPNKKILTYKIRKKNNSIEVYL